MAIEATLDLTKARPVGSRAAEDEGNEGNSGSGSGQEGADPDPQLEQKNKEAEEAAAKAKTLEAEAEAAKPIVYDPDQIPDDVFEKMLNKKTGGKISGVADLDDRLNNYVKPVNDRLKKAMAYAEKNGGDEMDFYKALSTDWKTIDQKDLVKMKTKAEFPDGVTDEQIEAILDKKYCLSEDPESAEYLIGQANLKKDAETVRNEKLAEQESAMIPPQARKEAEADSARKEAVKEWESRVDKGLSGFKGITINLGNGETFQHQPKDAASLQSMLSQLKAFLNDVNNVGTLTMMNSERYSGADGVQKLAEDIYFLNNKDSIISDLLVANKDGKMAEFVDNNLKGVDKTKTQNPGNVKADETWQQSVRRQSRERERGY